MSLESALDEERREVLNILEGRTTAANTPAQREQATSPPPQIRSMLDVSSSSKSQGSNANIGTSPSSQSSTPAYQSMIAPISAPPTKTTHSFASSPTADRPLMEPRHRSSSDSARASGESMRKITDKQGVDINQDYQFGMLPSVSHQAMPKRVSQGGRGLLPSSAMASAMAGDRTRGRELGRHNSTSGNKSRSPSSRIADRSQSPRVLPSMSASPGTFVTDSGKVIDMEKAYRRLSDITFRKLGSSLAPRRKSSTKRTKGEGGEDIHPDGDVRMHMDEDSDTERLNAELSDDDFETTEDEDFKSRGRGRNRRKKSVGNSEGEWEDEEPEKKGAGTPIGMGKGKGPRKVKSLLAAAEEERLRVSEKHKADYAGEPPISVTSAASEKMMPKKSGVHPHTSFDHTASGFNSEASSENEGDLSDIRRAQKLSINMSHIDNTVRNRAMRTILRGDFAKMELEAEEGLRRQRMYLVATDLSDEAVYALEWTIGTILRDGDTLFAMYAVDEETGTGKGSEAEAMRAQAGEGTRAAQEAVDTMATLTERAKLSPVAHPSPLITHGYLPATQSNSRPVSVDSRHMSKGEAERLHAIDDISQTCVRLLRKTRLQVRVAVEVIHCKSPKHLITEAVSPSFLSASVPLQS